MDRGNVSVIFDLGEFLGPGLARSSLVDLHRAFSLTGHSQAA
jgi:hypothetical protein